jgi:hypothetical protein
MKYFKMAKSRQEEMDGTYRHEASEKCLSNFSGITGSRERLVKI